MRERREEWSVRKADWSGTLRIEMVFRESMRRDAAGGMEGEWVVRGGVTLPSLGSCC